MAPMIGHDNATPIVSVGSATVLKWRVSGGGVLSTCIYREVRQMLLGLNIAKSDIFGPGNFSD